MSTWKSAGYSLTDMGVYVGNAGMEKTHNFRLWMIDFIFHSAAVAKKWRTMLTLEMV